MLLLLAHTHLNDRPKTDRKRLPHHTQIKLEMSVVVASSVLLYIHRYRTTSDHHPPWLSPVQRTRTVLPNLNVELPPWVKRGQLAMAVARPCLVMFLILLKSEFYVLNQFCFFTKPLLELGGFRRVSEKSLKLTVLRELFCSRLVRSFYTFHFKSCAHHHHIFFIFSPTVRTSAFCSILYV